ncbi:LamG domain-containing protein [Flavobacterium saccharophilum]|uniref:Concanavalin A-like lectin/glucanases superfamily protein n=1 Tax=Flavobacterium saccharophilum TaxID=29534 RepID=A0A1M7E5M5_9FLAO|nr:LamG domain-containing protein [Flavobacterium saccharophilum]SHL86908.1 Concanavalin A-like lectin/glucanases superfamily protein [Flavobacterium saccharophilum]
MKKILLTLMFVSFLSVNAQNPIQEFDFNGTLVNAKNTTSFMGTNNFVADRNGVANSAQRLVNKGMEAIIADLPQDNKARTVTIWVKLNDIASANYIWGYGTAYNAQYCGLLQQGTASSNSDLSLAGWGASNDVIVSTPLVKNTWYHYSITFDGTVSKIYRDGQLLKSVSGISRSTKGDIFRLGEINTTVGINADIDDLKIYNVAMTDEQILDQYNNSKPLIVAKEPIVASNAGKNVEKVKVATKTAPSNSIITTSEINGVTKNIEVYSQGQKIVGDSTMSINDLPEGTYLLKITNKPANKITSK